MINLECDPHERDSGKTQRQTPHVQNQQGRVKAWRQKQEGRRLDIYVSNSASWRLKRLAEVWGCFLAGAVERLALEVDEKYSEILFPETE